MPIAGHAVAGLAVATGADRTEWQTGRLPFGRRALVLVALAYLPDIATQIGVAAGFRSAPIVSHSVVFAAVATALLAPFVTRACSLRSPYGLALTLFSLLLHDGMDILQSPGRMPLWPLQIPVNLGMSWIPRTFAGELLTCLPFLILALAWQWRRRQWRLPARVDWASMTAVVLIVCAAASVSKLRDRREQELTEARALAESGQYLAALELCTKADRWPSPAAPGRVDYVRAMSWWGLGRADRAQELYLRSHEADPDYIWAVADLAVLYASSDAPLDERKRKAGYWLLVLRNRFANHPALTAQIARVERQLERAR